MIQVEELYQAYLYARKGKRAKESTRNFEYDLYQNLKTLVDKINQRIYRPAPSFCFYVQKPKLREIFAADFKDRVVHHWMVSRMESLFEKSFIDDSFACRKEKGTHKAVKRLSGWIKSQKPLFYLQLDIRGFFMEIHKPTLEKIVLSKIRNFFEKDPHLDDLVYLNQKIIRHDPCHFHRLKGKSFRHILPPHKTLFHPDKERGIPIGNLTSQFYANIYLNHLDQFVKRRLGVKKYLRFVDDFILISDDSQKLIDCRESIKEYLKDVLKLSLKEPLKNAEPVSKGIDFLGYFVRPRSILFRKRVIKSFRKALAESLPTKIEKKGWIRYFDSFQKWQKFQSRVNSYLAHFSHGNGKFLFSKFNQTIEPYREMLLVKKGFVRLRPRKPHCFQSWRHQVSFYRRLFDKSILYIQKGIRYERFEGFKNVKKEQAVWIKETPSIKNRVKERLPWIKKIKNKEIL